MIGIFREGVREKLASPDHLDELMHLTRPTDWLALASIAALLLALVVWSVVGTVPVTRDGNGILLREGGVRTVLAGSAGQIKDVLVDDRELDRDGNAIVGDAVTEDQAVATLQVRHVSDGVLSQHVVNATTPYSGQVVDVLVSPGDVVRADDPILRVESADPNLHCEVLVPLAVAKQVRPGMAAEVSPNYLKREVYGFIWGEVTHVAKYSTDTASINRLVGDPELTRYLMGNDPTAAPARLTVKLLPGDVRSTYRWSTGRGSSQLLSAGTTCQVRIVLSTTHPIELFFPSAAANN